MFTLIPRQAEGRVGARTTSLGAGSRRRWLRARSEGEVRYRLGRGAGRRRGRGVSGGARVLPVVGSTKGHTPGSAGIR